MSIAIIRKVKVEQIDKEKGIVENLRCINCGKILAKFVDLQQGQIEIKCKHCKLLSTFRFH